MKTTLATLAIITLSFSQANANDAVKQGILGVWDCVQMALDAGPGKPRVHPDAIQVAIRACEQPRMRLLAAMNEAGLNEAERQFVIQGVVDHMFAAWVIQ
jgi:hypothetical protein